MSLIGLEQQNKIFDYVLNNINDKPLVIDAHDLRNNPESILKKICKKLNIRFTKKMKAFGGNIGIKMFGTLHLL